MAAAVIATAAAEPIDYPKFQTSDASDDYFGTSIADPFRWLEDFHSDAAHDFVQKENALTAKWLPAPVQTAYRARLKALIDYPKLTVPFRNGPWWFTSRNTGLQPHNVLFKQRGENGEATVLIDPNTFSKDGTVALSTTVFTEDGALVAYGKAIGGSDDQTIYVRDVASGKDRPDVLKEMRFSNIAWAPDNSGFWYNKYPDPAKRANSTIYWHRLGDPQEKDPAIFSMPKNAEIDLTPAVTEDGKYLLVYSSIGTDEKNGLSMREVGKPERVGEFRELFPMGRAQYGIVGNDGTIFYIYTDENAPRRRLISIDTNEDRTKPSHELIPQEEILLDEVAMVGDEFVATFTRDVCSELRIYAKDGKLLRTVPLPAAGSANGVSGRRVDRNFFFLFSNYTTPGTIYRCALSDGKLTEYYRSQVRFDSDRYVTEEVFYQSKDGTRIPMWLAYRKGLKRDGKNPALLYGYGGFSISLEPRFSAMMVPWLEQGGVYAVANLRGGGEYGTAWHEAGQLGRKQNVFDDFIAAAQKLIVDGFTNSQKLAIEGGSNGGLLTAAVVLQRPDLFGAVISHVPVIDMFRYQRFGTGRFWTTEYGDATQSRETFEWLRKYSPLHNVKAGEKYPPILVTTADGDDRVVPLHAFKFVATLQSQAGPGVYLLRHETGAGHGGGKPLDKVVAEEANVYAFLTRALGLPTPDFSVSPSKKSSPKP